MGQPQKYIATNLEDWTRSDQYHNARLIGPPDPSLVHALQKSSENGLPEIAVSQAQGKYLNLLARTIRATRILEVGTLGGVTSAFSHTPFTPIEHLLITWETLLVFRPHTRYSTIWLARALPPGGQLITLEISAERAENIVHAGLESKVQILIGPAAESLATLQPDSLFDFIFIDADKEGNLNYFKEAKRLVRSGGVIIVDNVVRYGRVADLNVSDKNIEGVRRLLEYIKDDSTVDATTLATVGEKGYDGFLYALRL